MSSFHASAAVRRVDSTSLRVQQPTSTDDLVSLAMGEPNFDTPARIRQAADAALAAGYTHYAPLKGDIQLREALAQRMSTLRGGPVDVDQVIVTHGGSGGLAAAILGIVDPGDTVVVPDPTYSLYADLVSLAGGRLVPVPLTDDLHWDLDRLRDALVGARLFVFCNPGNPTGIVHTGAELEALGRMLDGTDTLVISDEAYSELVFGTEPFRSAWQVPALAERTVYCQTFSKSYAMTGWRVGYLAGPADVIAAAARVHATFNGSPNTAVQRAALVAVNECADDVIAMREVYRRRRALMLDGLRQIPSLSITEPDGAFYCFPRYHADLPATDVVAHLRSHGVATRPGSEFGRHGEHHIRLSYAASDEAIEEGVLRLAKALTDLN